MTDMLDAFEALQALQAARQNHRIMELSFPSGDGPPAVMLPNELDIDEGLSRDFRFTAEVLSDDACVKPESVLGRMVTIKLVREDGSLRYCNGYVFEFRLIRTDGGYAFYEMVLRPWLAYLRLRTNNRYFLDKTLQQIFDETCADCVQRDFRFDLAGEDPAHTYCCQFAESDHNHLHRRLEAQGIYYAYEHREDGHTLVLRDDSPSAPPIDGVPEIPFQAEAGSREDDGIAQLSPVHRAAPALRSLSTFDFKQPRPRVASEPSINDQGGVPRLEAYDYAGAYAFANSATGQAMARREMEAIEAGAQLLEASGNDRFAEPGRWCKITGHFASDLLDAGQDMELFIIEVRHTVRSNYLMGTGIPAVYTNTLTCCRRKTPWRPVRGHHSTQPRIYGVQTAIVVCPDGEEIHTDEYSRVRVQFHWDRTGQYNLGSSAPVRVATPLAGQGFGLIALPRRGQEVIVQWLDGNPDLPLIVGRVANADNMPPRFNHEGSLPANHALSGWNTRELGGSALQQLRFNDTHGKTSTQLASDHRASQCNLGSLQTNMREGRTEPRGEGLELRTLAAAVVRATQGLLLLTEPNGDEGKQLARAELQASLDAAREIMKSLDAAARTAEADAIDPAPQQQLEADIDQLEGGTNTAPESPGGQRPVIGIGGSAGIALATPKSTTVYTGENLDLVANGDLQQTANKRWLVNAGQSIGWFVAGVADRARQAAQAIAVKLIAARGNVLVQAQRGGIDLQAERDIALGANARVSINAQGGVTITEMGGAQIELSGGNITMKCQRYTVHAGAVSYTAQAGAVPQLPRMPGSAELRPWLGLNYLDPDTGLPIENAPYDVRYAGGVVQSGTLNTSGQARHDTVPDAKVVEVVYKPRKPHADQPIERLKTLLA